MLSSAIRTLLTFTLFLLLLSPQRTSVAQKSSPTVCIVGSGIGGSSVAHFLRRYSTGAKVATPFNIRMFERNAVPGGRMAVINVSGHVFEAGGSILHPQNFHVLNYTKLLNLSVKKRSSSDSFSLGIWNGKKFVFKTLKSPFSSQIPFVDKIVSLANEMRMFLRYGFSLLKMENFVENTVNKFLTYYKGFESRPIFETVDEMLKWAGFYDLTTRTLQQELMDAGLSPILIEELVTVITRINYGQSLSISGLAGAVSLAGSGGGLWAVEGGNWQMADGLIKSSDVALHLQEEVDSITDHLGEHYEIKTTKGNTYTCEVAVVATPLDEVNIEFTPPISIPHRELQHTHATFIRGLLNPKYFGLDAVSDLPELVGTLEDDILPFSSISILKQHSEDDMTYKVFSRKPMEETLLDSIFSVRRETIRIDWGAYPLYEAPEVFAPFVLDGEHLYYVNAFENAASTMETMAVAAENVARLVLSRYFSHVSLRAANVSPGSGEEKILHTDL